MYAVLLDSTVALGRRLSLDGRSDSVAERAWRQG